MPFTIVFIDFFDIILSSAAMNLYIDLLHMPGMTKWFYLTLENFIGVDTGLPSTVGYHFFISR